MSPHRVGVDNVVFTGQDFSGLLAAVANGQFDVGVAAIGITDKRKQTVDFSDGYLAGYLTVITTRPRASPTPTDLAGKRLGVVQGTLQEAYAVKNFTDDRAWCASRTTTPRSPRSTAAPSTRTSSTTRRRRNTRTSTG